MQTIRVYAWPSKCILPPYTLSLGSFPGEFLFELHSVPFKPALSAPEGASDPLRRVASPEKIPYFEDQLLTGKAGAPCRSIGLPTINYQHVTYKFATLECNEIEK